MTLTLLLKITFISFGLALAIFLALGVVLMFAEADIDTQGNRLLFSGCFLISIPIAVKYII